MMEATKHTIIGTAGHVDHGKSALIHALTGIETDRLKEEKERGLSIELGFAYFDLPDGSRAGIIDVPGHEKFIRSMLSGAYGMDMVLLVVDAKEGMQEQTIEHLEIIDLLGISNGILVITKIDLVSMDQLQDTIELTKELLYETSLANVPTAAVSSITGEGINQLKKIICEKLPTASVPIQSSQSGRGRLYVDRAFSQKGFGVVTTGTLIGGVVHREQRLQVLPAGDEVRVRGIQVHGNNVQTAMDGQRTALNLSGTSLGQVPRGSVLCPLKFSLTTNNIDVHVQVLDSFPRMLEHWAPLRFYIGTCEVFCRAIMLIEDAVFPGDKASMQLRLDKPILTFKDDRFILRDSSAEHTVGGGRVLNPFADRHKRMSEDTIDRLEQWTQAQSDLDVLQLILDDHFSISVDFLHYYFSISEKLLTSWISDLTQSGDIVQWTGKPTEISSSNRVKSVELKVEQLLNDYHQDKPLDIGLNIAQAREKLGLNEPVFDKLIQRMVTQKKVEKVGNQLRLFDHQIAFNGNEAAIKNEIEDLFQRSGINTPSLSDTVIHLTNYDYTEASVRETFSALVNLGQLIKIEDGIFIHRSIFDQIRFLIIEYLEENQTLTVAEFRELVQTSRKYAVPFLEYCDRQGITIREGNCRKLRSK